MTSRTTPRFDAADRPATCSMAACEAHAHRSVDLAWERIEPLLPPSAARETLHRLGQRLLRRHY